MSYPDELCRLFIRNMKLLDEGASVIDEIQSVIFTAINARLETLVSTLDGWDGEFDLVIDNGNGKTRFAPHSWSELKLAYELYETETENDEAYYWTTSALGKRKSKLCLRIIPDKRSHKQRSQAWRFANISDNTDVFHNNSIEFNEKTGVFYVTCVLDIDKVIAEYPHLDESLAVVNQAFDRMLAAHEHFERIAKGDLTFYASAE